MNSADPHLKVIRLAVTLNPVGLVSASGSHSSKADHYLFAPLVFDNMRFGGEPLARWQTGFSVDVEIPITTSALSSLDKVTVALRFGKGN